MEIRSKTVLPQVPPPTHAKIYAPGITNESHRLKGVIPPPKVEQLSNEHGWASNNKPKSKPHVLQSILPVAQDSNDNHRH